MIVSTLQLVCFLGSKANHDDDDVLSSRDVENGSYHSLAVLTDDARFVVGAGVTATAAVATRFVVRGLVGSVRRCVRGRWKQGESSS